MSGKPRLTEELVEQMRRSLQAAPADVIIVATETAEALRQIMVRRSEMIGSPIVSTPNGLLIGGKRVLHRESASERDQLAKGVMSLGLRVARFEEFEADGIAKLKGFYGDETPAKPRLTIADDEELQPYACAAMTGLLANSERFDPVDLAEKAWDIAEMMFCERKLRLAERNYREG